MTPENQAIIDRLVITGVERDYTPEERAAIENALFGDALKEHERLKAEGRLHEIVIEDEEDEHEDWHEDMIEEDDEQVVDAIYNSLYPDDPSDEEELPDLNEDDEEDDAPNL